MVSWVAGRGRPGWMGVVLAVQLRTGVPRGVPMAIGALRRRGVWAGARSVVSWVTGRDRPDAMGAVLAVQSGWGVPCRVSMGVGALM